MPQTDDITPRVLLDHMQAMQRSLERKIGDLSGRMDGLSERMDRGFAEVKGEIRRLDRKIDVLTAGVDQIDARLDAIEIEKLPQRVRALEMKR